MTNVRFYLILLVLGFLLSISTSASSEAAEITLVRDGKPNAAIIRASAPTPSAKLAALELQYHIEKITGAILPIKTDQEKVQGIRILVGESAATRALGLKGTDFKPQEYLIRFIPDTVILIGRDWQDTEKNRKEAGRGTNWPFTLAYWRETIDYAAATNQTPQNDAGKKLITLPGLFDEQGTCYATYDFLERFCDVRWYGPTELNIILPRRSTLTVRGRDVRRCPAMKHREGIGGGWPIIKAQWNNPNQDELKLYWRRLRVGGEKWAGNHSFRSFQDRFLRKNPERPELFEVERPEFFAMGQSGGSGTRQLCYTNPALVAQVVQDARDYFDGKPIKGYQLAMGDYFAIVPLDNNKWCECDKCQALLSKDKSNITGQHFSNGTASHYWFSFINAVAREVRKTHPDKYISTLAYHVYAFRPEDFQLESNVAVAPCLQPRNYWAPRVKRNDIDFYKKWVVRKDRRIYLWNYYCFPTEMAVMQGWNCFPGFSAHELARQIKMYHKDGVRGVFLCGIGEQADYYLTMKMYDDPSIDPDELLNEFFSRYFGSASEPMKQFYTRIEEIFCNPDNYPEEVRVEDKQFHQTEELAWKYLGTKERMKELGALMRQARKLAVTELEKKRVRSWEKGVWNYMVQGRKKYLAKQIKPQIPAE